MIHQNILLLIFIVILFLRAIIFFRENFQFWIECKGKKEFCLTSKVVKIVDGDTLFVENLKMQIRLSLVEAPEKQEKGYEEAKEFAINLCLHKKAFIDIDDAQIFDEYGRYVAVVYCNGKNLNEELLKNGLASLRSEYCLKSEFFNERWAKDFGC